MRTLEFSVLILVVILNSFNCSTPHHNEADPKCCANATNQRVFVEFSSNVVQHEYIVQFTNYYQKESRAKFLQAALDNLAVCRLNQLALINTYCKLSNFR